MSKVDLIDDYIEVGYQNFSDFDFNTLAYKRVLIITEDKIYNLYKQLFLTKKVDIFIVSGTELNKNYSNVEKITEHLLKLQFNRHDLLVAVGGGVIGDIVGFVAASYMRGIDYINVPTTLLGQVDSSIGGKVAINFKTNKNILGFFYEPKRIIVDLMFLETLDQQEIQTGLAEIIKIALLKDRKLFTYLYNVDELDYLYIIKRAITLKQEIVATDFMEADQRKLLNFGHTLGHAIELKYNLTHGLAVAIGMKYMIKLYGSQALYQQYLTICEKYGLAIDLPIDNSVFTAIVNDKKAIADDIDIAVVSEVGSSMIIRLPSSEFIKRLGVVNESFN